MSKSSESPKITRRHFMRLGATSAGALAAGGAGLLTGCADEQLTAPSDGAFLKRGGNGGGGNKPAPTRNALYVPGTVTPGDDPTSPFVLNMAPTSVDLGGQMSSAWAYNGTLPGPTIIANRRQSVAILMENRLGRETITHWHGMIIDHANDGHPVSAVRDGADYAYRFLVDQRAALNWYHPHPHGETGEQVNLGLAGAFIVRDTDEESGLPQGLPYEVPLIIRDAKFDKAGNISYQNKKSGYEGNTPLVNGTLDARLDVDTAVYRFRMLNGANARNFRLVLGDGTTPFHLIGNDGGLLEQGVDVYEILASPAERFDIIIDFSEANVGDRLMLRDLDTGWDLLEFNVTRQVNNLISIPSSFRSIDRLANPVNTVEFAFEGMSRINGQEFEMTRVDYRIPLGQTERWIFTTAGNAPHPVHVHAAPFQIQSRTGGRNTLYPWEQGWKDSVLLEDGETVEVLVRFEHESIDLRGMYLLHCHKLEHEDAGMMMNFVIE